MPLIGPHRSTGFTLIEALATAAVLVVVLALGVPLLSDLLHRTRLDAVTNTLLGHLQFARSAAVQRGRDRVAIGPCDSAATWRAQSAWEGSYMVAIVADSEASNIIEVLRRVDGADLVSVSITTNGITPRFYFHPDGTSSVSATLTVCDKADPAQARAVVVDRMGRIRVSEHKPGGGTLGCPPK